MAAQERLSTKDHRGSSIQQSLRCLKYELKKMKETRAEPEFRHELENLTSALGAIDDPQDANSHSRNTEDRNEPSVISELREEIGAAKAGRDAAKAAADEAQAADLREEVG
jgi:hypothetical protein